MGFVDRALAAVAPKAAYRRAAWRMALDEIEGMIEKRRYAGADRSRLNGMWGSALGPNNTQLGPDLATLRAASRQLVRDNPHAVSAKKNLVAHIVGSGIKARAVHADPKVAALAQEVWTEFANAKGPDGLNFYQKQKITAGDTIVDGEGLLWWQTDGKVPDAYCVPTDAARIATHKTEKVGNGGRIVNGVEFDKKGHKVALHLFKDAPGDPLAESFGETIRVEIANIDHVFEHQWAGQVRGVPWFHAAIRRLSDIDDVDEAMRIKERIAACLAVFRTPGADDDGAPLGAQAKDAAGRTEERLAPGMIIKGLPGEKIEVVQPPKSDGGSAFRLGQMQAVAASLGIPVHVLTGDVSQANYSSLRAAMVVFWALLDDWVWNTFVPFMCEPAFKRVMRRASVERRQPKLLEVTAEWTPAPRAWVDPLKDITAQIMEVRAGFSSLPEALAARGRAWRPHVELQAEVNKVLDQHGVAYDTDPRRLNGSGGLQPPVGYLAPQAGQNAVSRVADFMLRASQTLASGQQAAVTALYLEAAQGIRAGDPAGPMMAEILKALTEDF